MTAVRSLNGQVAFGRSQLLAVVDELRIAALRCPRRATGGLQVQPPGIGPTAADVPAGEAGGLFLTPLAPRGRVSKFTEPASDRFQERGRVGRRLALEQVQ